jgi:dipeptidyl aminopeptidase/acylaminoacyl peptidase
MFFKQALTILLFALSPSLAWCKPTIPNAAAAPKTAAEISVYDFVRQAEFTDLSLSPDGKYLAMIIPKDDRSAFAVLDLATMKPTLNIQQRQDEYISNATWVSNTRIVLALGRRFSGFDAASPTGELAAVNFDGTKSKYIFGFRGRESTGTNIKLGLSQYASAQLMSDRLTDERFAQIAVRKWDSGPDTKPEWCRLDVFSGAQKCERAAPGKGALSGYLLDENNRLRWLALTDADEAQALYYRAVEGDWKKVITNADGRTLHPLAWSSKNSEIYVAQVSAAGPAALATLDPETGLVKVVFQPTLASIGDVVLGLDRKTPFAVTLGEGRGGYKPLKTGPELDLLKALSQTFPGEVVLPAQFSTDGKKALIAVGSDVSARYNYIYDFNSKKLTELGSARRWLPSALMATTEVLQVSSRDGLILESYLTLPAGASKSQPVPMVLIPHGGPFGVRDYWGFDSETQLLASRGYAVLRVNFRGSGGYGLKFERAGYKQWGQAMQTDLTDAVNTVIKRGDIDANRLAIYGASYGGYAALMGGITEPARYKAVISYVGVTDLPLMYTRGDIEDTTYGQKYLARALGKVDLEQYSPVNLAEELKAPVLIVHGGQDRRVPIAHAERMRDALKKAGNAPEWLVKPKEEHGFFATDSKVEMYTKLLSFLDQHVKNATKQ